MLVRHFPSAANVADIRNGGSSRRRIAAFLTGVANTNKDYLPKVPYDTFLPKWKATIPAAASQLLLAAAGTTTEPKIWWHSYSLRTRQTAVRIFEDFLKGGARITLQDCTNTADISEFPMMDPSNRPGDKVVQSKSTETDVRLQTQSGVSGYLPKLPLPLLANAGNRRSKRRRRQRRRSVRRRVALPHSRKRSLRRRRRGLVF